MTAANKDDKLVSIRAEFGMWGLGVYWTLVELVAEQLSEKSDRAEATLILQEMLGLFSVKRKQLICFLEATQNQTLLSYRLDGNLLKINIPKLLEFADNYIKYDGKSLKSLQRQNKMSSKQEEEVEEDKKEKKKEHIRTSFQTPSLDEVKAYLTELSISEESEAFFDYYTTNGWHVGKNPMKDWKAACRNWKRNQIKFKGNGNGQSRPSNPNSAAARASYSHKPEDEKRFRELKESLDLADRERNKRTGTH